MSGANIHIDYKIFIKKHVQYYYKKIHNSILIQARYMKINIHVFPYLLNNFTYALFARLVWPKCLNYVMKVKNKLRFSIIQKKCTTPYPFKLDTQKLINIQVFSYLLNNFTYASFTHLVWPKCPNYVVKVKNKLHSV